MNAVNLIDAYFDGGMWVFDEPRFGLQREPFVAGASEAIDRALARKFPGQVAKRCRILFSATPLPEADFVAEREGSGADADVGGCYYHDDTARFWLCPAMRHYLGRTAPEKLYATFQIQA